MELTDILIDLSNSKAALMAANRTIQKLNGKCVRKNLLIIGLAWFSMTACKMLGESEKKRKEAEDRVRDAEAACAKAEAQLWDERSKKDVCCDGKASVDKKEV